MYVAGLLRAKMRRGVALRRFVASILASNSRRVFRTRISSTSFAEESRGVLRTTPELCNTGSVPAPSSSKTRTQSFWVGCSLFTAR